MTLYSAIDIKAHFNLSDGAFEKIEIYHALLLKWQKAINLISPATIPQAWHRHFMDSAQLSKFIPDHVETYADLGCGGGFPGLVLAMMRPEMAVHLVESDERKGQFMRTVIREAEVKNATVHTQRVEAMIDTISPDFISARALASLDKLFEYCLPWAQKNSDLQFCFMKGERVDDEIDAAQNHYDFHYEKHQSLTDESACLLVCHSLIVR